MKAISFFALLMTFSASAAVHFRRDEFKLRVQPGENFKMALATLLQEPAPAHVTWVEPRRLPKWLTFSSSGLISGTPTADDALSFADFNLFVTDDEGGDVTRIMIDVGDVEHMGPTWTESPIMDETCLGKTYQSDNWGDKVFDFSGAVMVRVDFIDPPAWLKRVGTGMKAYAMGNPTAADKGSHSFTIRAFTRSTHSDNKVVIEVKDCPKLP